MKRAKVKTVKAQSQRLLSIVLSACLFSMVLVGGAYAYTGTPAAIFGSGMVTGGVDIAIPDQGGTVYYVPGQTVKLSHPIRNDGADSYVRVQFASNDAVAQDGIQVVSGNWQRFDDGYWYYKGTQEDGGVLRAGDENPLSVEYTVQFSESGGTEDSGSSNAEKAQVTLQAQAVQSANFQPDYEKANPWGDKAAGSGIGFGDPKELAFRPATLDVTFENLTSENVVRGKTAPVVTRVVGGKRLQLSGSNDGSVGILPGDQVDYQVMLGRDSDAKGKLRVYLWATAVESDAVATNAPGSGAGGVLSPASDEAGAGAGAGEASFARYTDLTVFDRASGAMLYEGKVSDILNPETNGQAYLGEYEPGANETLDFTLKVSELLGNEFENMKLNFALEISTDGDESDESVPVTPTRPDPTPTTPTTPTGTATATATTTSAAATPAPPAITTISDADVPLAPETIDDEGNPLGSMVGCWVHPWIVLGIVLTTVHSLVILIRRQRNSNKHQDFDDDVMGLNDGRERKEREAGAWRPVPQPAMSAALE